MAEAFFDNTQQPRCVICQYPLVLRPVRGEGYVFCCQCNHPELIPGLHGWKEIGIDLPADEVKDQRFRVWETTGRPYRRAE